MITSSRASSIARFLLLAAVSILLTATLQAQMPPSSSTTSTPVPGVGHDYLGGLADTVNPANGSLSIRVSTMMPPGRGLTLPFSFAYDSNGVNAVSINRTGDLQWLPLPGTPVSAGGWSESVPVISANQIKWTAYSDLGKPVPCFGYTNYTYQDPEGNRHNLNLTTYNDVTQQSPCTTDTNHFPIAFDGIIVNQGGDGGYDPTSGRIVASMPNNGLGGAVTVSDTAGTSFTFPGSGSAYQGGEMASSVEDRNGNVITISPPTTTHGPYSYSDTLGRTVLQDSGFTVSPETLTIPGLGAPSGGSYTLTWGTKSANFTDSTTTLFGNCGSEVQSNAWSAPVVTSIELPNSKSYSFSYESTYGLVNKLTYPTGGYVSYSWAINPQAEWGENLNPLAQCAMLYGMPVVTDRYVSFDGTNVVLHQHFSYTTTWSYGQNGNANWTSKQTTVTTTDNVRNTSYTTVYTYSPSGSYPPPNSMGPTKADPVESSIAYYDTNGSLLKTVTKTWLNPRDLTSQTTTYPTGPASETTWSYNSRDLQTEQDDYDFGTTGVGSLLRKTLTSYQAFTNLNIVDRPCQSITYDSTGTNRVAETDYFYDNGATTTPCGTAGTPSLTSAGGSSLTGHDETNYSATSTTPRGNLTQKTQWLNTGSSPATTFAYDETGQIVSSTDPNLNQTSYSYTDNYLNTNTGSYTSTAGSPPTGKKTNAYLTQITHPVTNGIAHIEKFSYGYNDGELTQLTDQNSQNTTYRYNDLLGRLTETDAPDLGLTTVSYNDTTPSVTTTKAVTSSLNLTSTSVMDGLGHVIQTQLTSDPDGTTYTATTYDGNGKTYQAFNPTRCTTPTTNCGTETTWGYTEYLYDGLGRTCLVVPPDGTVPTSLVCPTTAPAKSTFTSYTANQSTVTDEAGHQRTSQVDGLGRLTFVWEAPNVTGYNFETDYAYDTYGNLISVNQKGGSSNSANWRPRSFTYDSLSRLVCAANPEVKIVTCPSSATGTFPAGAITYSYDANGNVLSKVAPKPGQTSTATVTTNYSYDALNRLTQKSYVGLTLASSKYGYDGTALTSCGQNPPTITSPTNLIGRRSAMCAGKSGSSWSYDSMGRALLDVSINASTGQQTKYSVAYTYNLDGSINTLTYPSGDVLTYAPGGAGRSIGLSDSTNTYVASGTTNRATFAPNGALATMANGYTSSFAGILTSNLYNDRLQPMLLSASVSSNSIFSLCYDYHLGVVPTPTNPCALQASNTGDNGSVFQILNNVDPTRSAAFQYDPLNRISQANTTNTTSANCWGETYTIDPWGNLTNRAAAPGMGSNCATEPLNDAPATTQNQLTGITYDAAGNVTNDGIGNQPTYDAENRIATEAGVTYYYDADGARMEKSSGTKYWFGPAGVVLTETGLTGTINEEYVYFNGERIARIDRPSGTVHYYFSNHLGSASVITSATGTIQEQMDFYPFGGVAYTSGSDTNHFKFTGKERDPESGFDNFGARYFESNVGRFMTPDWAARPTAVPYAVFGDPQSLNLYIYVRNDPVTRADADGHQDPPQSPITPDSENAECRYEHCNNTLQAQNTFAYVSDRGSGTITYTQETVTQQFQKDGSWTGTITVTTATFSTKEDDGGKFLSGTTQTSNATGPGAIFTDPIAKPGKVTSLSDSDAMKALGGPTFQSMQGEAAERGAPGLLTITGRDMKKDPVKYVGVAAGVTSKVCPNPLCRAAAGAVAAGAGAYEAWKHTYGTPSQ